MYCSDGALVLRQPIWFNSGFNSGLILYPLYTARSFYSSSRACYTYSSYTAICISSRALYNSSLEPVTAVLDPSTAPLESSSTHIDPSTTIL